MFFYSIWQREWDKYNWELYNFYMLTRTDIVNNILSVYDDKNVRGVEFLDICESKWQERDSNPDPLSA